MKPYTKKEPLQSLLEGNFAKEVSISNGKIPPNVIDFEQLIIGTLLIDKSAFDMVEDTLSTQVFYDPRHATIFEAMASMRKRQIPLDISTLIMELKRKEQLSIAGGDHYIIDLTMGVSSTAHLEYHAKVVYEKYILRGMINAGGATIDAAYKETTDVFDLLAANRKVLENFEDEITQMEKSATTLEINRQVIANLNKPAAETIPSYLKELQKNMSGHALGSLTIIAARSGVGKSTFGLNIATKTALSGVPAGYVSIEMSATELHKRAIADICNVSFYRLMNGKTSNEDVQKIFQSSDIIEQMPLYYDESIELYTICSKIRKMAKNGVKLVVVDYIQIIKLDLGRNASREQIVSTITQTLKQLAKQLNIAIIGLAQLLREVDKRAIKRPQISDLRESSSLESDADVVMLLYRPEIYKVATWDCDWDGCQDLPTAGEIEINIAKYRNGAPFQMRAKFWGDHQRIMNIDDDGQFYNPVPFTTESGKAVDDDDNDFDTF